MTPAITFEEKQVNPPWMGLLVGCIGVTAIAFLLFHIWKSWPTAGGELTEELKDLLGGAAAMSIGFTVLVWMVFSIQLMVIVDREGLTYFCFPLYFSEKRIEGEGIVSFRIRKITFTEFLQSGGRRRLFLRGPQKKVICVIRCCISYLFVPTFMDAKRIEADQVESFELRKMTFSEFISSTKSKRALHKVDQQKEICVMKGWTVVNIQLRDGRRVILGTENPDGMLWALKRLQNQG